jgi:hypothetical protein
VLGWTPLYPRRSFLRLTTEHRSQSTSYPGAESGRANRF